MAMFDYMSFANSMRIDSAVVVSLVNAMESVFPVEIISPPEI